MLLQVKVSTTHVNCHAQCAIGFIFLALVVRIYFVEIVKTGLSREVRGRVIAFLLNYACSDSIEKSKAVFALSPVAIPF